MDIIHLLDYQGRFGSKHDDAPYRSGFDLNLLRREYAELEINPVFIPFSEVDLLKNNYTGQFIAYTSAEDPGYHYKAFVEDIVLSLELSGAKMLPKFIFLRATNNKVFMEKLREIYFPKEARKFATMSFGSADELNDSMIKKLKFPVIVKSAEGASGQGVFLAQNEAQLLQNVKKISRTKNLRQEAWDIGRAIKHKGYKRESLFRRKFILQKFIPNLINDWKIYVFGSRYYIFFRPILKHRKFKASGGGYQNYSYGENAKFPEGIFDFAKRIYEKLHVPHVSLDIAYDGTDFYLLEFQSVYFGTAGIVKSNCYFSCAEDNKGQPIFEKRSIENVYANSIKEFISKNNKS
jgi:glutathione synthase/RimK-type ligase-like ATP-grasp enzyme